MPALAPHTFHSLAFRERERREREREKERERKERKRESRHSSPKG
jgi:hypothetical protein